MHWIFGTHLSCSMPLLISQEIDSRVERLSSSRQLVICPIHNSKEIFDCFVHLDIIEQKSKVHFCASGFRFRLSQTVKIWSIHSLFIEESEMFQEQIQAILLQRLC